MVSATIYSSFFFARSSFERSVFRRLKTCSTLFCSGMYGGGKTRTIFWKIGSIVTTLMYRGASSTTIVEPRYFLPNQSQSFIWRSSKKNMMYSDFALSVYIMNVYLWGSIIAATTLIHALGLMMRSGLYLYHHEYSLMFWGQTDASSI